MSLGLLRVQVSALEKGLPQETNLNTPFTQRARHIKEDTFA